MRLFHAMLVSVWLMTGSVFVTCAQAQSSDVVERLLQEGIDQYQAGLTAFARGDYQGAMEHWRPLAERGSVDAQNNLGYLYANGLGVPQDYEQAREWYRRSAMQGDASGQHNLGLSYALGRGTPTNPEEALNWYRKAADQLYPEAVRSLAIVHYHGRGVPRDPVKAFMWFQVAAELGHPTAAQSLALVKRELSPDQAARAREDAMKWLQDRSR